MPITITHQRHKGRESGRAYKVLHIAGASFIPVEMLSLSILLMLLSCLQQDDAIKDCPKARSLSTPKHPEPAIPTLTDLPEVLFEPTSVSQKAALCPMCKALSRMVSRETTLHLNSSPCLYAVHLQRHRLIMKKLLRAEHAALQPCILPPGAVSLLTPSIVRDMQAALIPKPLPHTPSSEIIQQHTICGNAKDEYPRSVRY